MYHLLFNKYLIDFIKNNIAKFKGYFLEFREFLTKGCPTRESLVEDPNNRLLIEKVRPPARFK